MKISEGMGEMSESVFQVQLKNSNVWYTFGAGRWGCLNWESR